MDNNYNLCDPDKIEAFKAYWSEWLSDRPESVKAVGAKINPMTLYRLKSTGQRVTLLSIFENGTVRVDITGEFNLIDFERNVFGVDPDTLEACELPDPSEKLGALLTPQQVDENADLIKAFYRPDLWELDADGKAQWIGPPRENA